jgi:CDP-diacylglycerol--glycerol-3-phosphate 3-phosphatidyltransferase
MYVRDGRDLAALIVFLVAGLTDTLDGTIARRFQQASKLGRLTDPLADKLLTGVAYLALSFLREGFRAIPVWLTIAVIVRDVVILAGSLWIVSRRRQTGAFQPSWLGKLNTFIEITVVTVFLAASFLEPLAQILPILYILAIVSIVCSGIDYSRAGIRIMQAPDAR